MAKADVRTLTVLAADDLTPNMRRLSLGGDGLAGFPADQAGGYVKLMVPGGSDGSTVVRTYTIAEKTADAIAVEFVLHGDDGPVGPATRFALDAKPGDRLPVGGPGLAKPLPPGPGPFLMAGDMTALPAILVNLRAMSDDARGHVIIAIRSNADRRDVSVPARVELEWVLERDVEADEGGFAGRVRRVPWARDLRYAWVACEFEAMRHVRAYLRDERLLGSDRLYASSYWKRGLDEAGHKEVKRADAELMV